MRPGAIAPDQMTFARLRPEGGLPGRLAEVTAFAKAAIAAHSRQRRGRHPSDKMGLNPLEVFKPLFYHAPRLGEEFADDGGNMIDVWDSRAYGADAHAALKAAALATGAMDRSLRVRWGDAEAGSIADVEVDLFGTDHQATAGPNFKPYYKVYFKAGEYFDRHAFKPREQAAGWRAAVEAVGAASLFRPVEANGVEVLTFAPEIPTARDQHFPNIAVASLPVSGKTYRFRAHDDVAIGGKHFEATIFTGDLADPGEALVLADRVVAAVAAALGPPSDVTLEFQIVTKDLPRYADALAGIGRVFSLVNPGTGYRRRFDPLKAQDVPAGEARAYPLLLWQRYRDGLGPISPMLAVNAVHAADGPWVELQSSGRPDLIAEAAKILGGEPEYWTGSPASRWGWYADAAGRGTAVAGATPLAEEIARRAEGHVSNARETFGLEFDYSPESLGLLDRAITEYHGDRALFEGTVVTYGAYVGETVRRSLGGEWAAESREAVPELRGVGGSATVFPFAWAEERFAGGGAVSAKYAELLAALGRPGEARRRRRPPAG